MTGLLPTIMLAAAASPMEVDVAYDEDLADRVRVVLGEVRGDWDERKMFGGLAFMVAGHMTVGVLGDDLLVRVGKEAYDDALAEPHAREMDFTGRPMTGMVFVGNSGVAADTDLRTWIGRGLDHTRCLPPK
ncbi:MAG: TfoX/Sxy family protein [Actinomycetota bacterium]|nr:TfoX/Sxy family protein [Actinomycetota bacterium]